MATKTKPKSRKSPAKKAAKPKATKRSAPKQRKPKGKSGVVANHRFAPGTEVGFWDLHAVGVERSMSREPFPVPISKAKVGKDGTLKYSGLSKGQFLAAAPVDEDSTEYRYCQFSVK